MCALKKYRTGTLHIFQKGTGLDDRTGHLRAACYHFVNSEYLAAASLAASTKLSEMLSQYRNYARIALWRVYIACFSPKAMGSRCLKTVYIHWTIVASMHQTSFECS